MEAITAKTLMHAVAAKALLIRGLIFEGPTMLTVIIRRESVVLRGVACLGALTGHHPVRLPLCLHVADRIDMELTSDRSADQQRRKRLSKAPDQEAHGPGAAADGNPNPLPGVGAGGAGRRGRIGPWGWP